MKVLHIDSSANLSGLSLSRSLSAEFIKQLTAKKTEVQVTYRDVSKNPIPFVDDTWVNESHHEITKQLVDEFLEHDLYVFGIPVYNLNIPASFKAYIDQIVVAGKTFQYNPEGPKGLVPEGRKMFIMGASGTPYEMLNQFGINYHEPYLKSIFGFIGVEEVQVMPYSARGEEQIKEVLESAKKDISNKIDSL